jgi:hypothetical protein
MARWTFVLNAIVAMVSGCASDDKSTPSDEQDVLVAVDVVVETDTEQMDSGQSVPEDVSADSAQSPEQTGTLSVRVLPSVSVMNAEVKVYAVRTGQQPWLVGTGETDANGAAEVVWTLPAVWSALPELWRVDVAIGETDVLSAYAAGTTSSEVTVHLLSSWGVALASKIATSEELAMLDAWSVASTRINEHFLRPGSVDLVRYRDSGEPGLSARIVGHVDAALARLASSEGTSLLTLNSALLDDLADGVFDGLEDGAPISMTSIGVETTRYALAEAIWLNALNDESELDWLLSPGGLVEDISTDSGPLYPNASLPVAFVPPSAVIVWLPPLVEAESWWHDQTIIANFSVEGAADFDVYVDSPAGAFAAVQDDGTYRITVDALTLTEGAAEVAVRIETAAGTVSDSLSINVDHTPPILTGVEWIEAGTVLQQSELPIQLAASDVGAGVVGLELIVDGVAVTTNTADGVDTILTLTDGSHSIVAKATDGVGLETQLVSEFVVDATPPTLVWESPQSGDALSDQNVTFAGQASDSVHPIQHVVVSLPTGQSQTLSVDDTGKFNWQTFIQAEGLQLVSAVAVDSIGQESEPVSVSFYLDVTPPYCSAPPHYNPWIGSLETPIKVYCSDSGAGVVSVTMTYASVGSVPLSYNSESTNYEGLVTFPSISEKHGQTVSIVFTATDLAGNQLLLEANPTVDTEPPTIQPTNFPQFVGSAQNAVAGGYIVDELSGAASVTVSSSLESITTDLTDTPSGAFNTFVEMIDPEDSLSIVSTDRAGNVSDVTTQVVAIDMVPPVLNIDAPEYGTNSLHALPPGTTSWVISGIISDDASGPELITWACFGQVSTEPIALIPSADAGTSTWSVTVDADETGGFGNGCAFTPWDSAGNKGVTTVVKAKVDNAPPTLIVDPIPLNDWYGPGDIYQLTGLTQDQNSVSYIVVEVAGQSTTHPASAGPWQVELILPNVHGPVVVSVIAIDIFGNTSAPKEVTIKVDAEGPVIESVILSSAAVEEIQGVNWTKADTLFVSCTASDAISSPVTTCINGDCSTGKLTSVAYVSLEEGENTISCVTTDVHGNQSVQEATVWRDTIAPVLTTDFVEGLWHNSGPFTLTGTVSDTGVGLNKISVGYASTTQPVAYADNGDFSWTGTYSSTSYLTITVNDLLGNSSVASYTVQIDTTPPSISTITSEYNWELGADVVWNAGEPEYIEGVLYNIPDQCYGDKCYIHKFATRARYAEFNDIEKNNLPHWVFSVADNESNGSVTLEYRFLRDDQPLTDWRMVDDLIDGLDDSTFTVVWALESFTDTANEFLLTSETAPDALTIRATDAQGLTSDYYVALETNLHTPPLLVESVPLVEDGTEMQAYEIFDGSLLSANSGKHRLLSVEITNPWDSAIQYRLVPGWYEENVTGRREWMVFDEDSASQCNANASCGLNQCILLWPGSDYQCTDAPEPALETFVAGSQGNLKVSVYDEAGMVPTTTDEDGDWRMISAGSTHQLSLSGNSNSTCGLRFVQDLSYVAPGGTSQTKDVTIFDDSLTCGQTWTVPDAAATCQAANGCMFGYGNPFVVHSVSYTLWTANATVKALTRLPVGESSTYFYSWYAADEVNTTLHSTSALPDQVLESTLYSPL